MLLVHMCELLLHPQKRALRNRQATLSLIVRSHLVNLEVEPSGAAHTVCVRVCVCVCDCFGRGGDGQRVRLRS